MEIKLTTKQRTYLNKMIFLQDLEESDKDYFNNGIRYTITEVLRVGEYDTGDQITLNEMNQRYKKFLDEANN